MAPQLQNSSKSAPKNTKERFCRSGSQQAACKFSLYSPEKSGSARFLRSRSASTRSDPFQFQLNSKRSFRSQATLDSTLRVDPNLGCNARRYLFRAHGSCGNERGEFGGERGDALQNMFSMPQRKTCV